MLEHPLDLFYDFRKRLGNTWQHRQNKQRQKTWYRARISAYTTPQDEGVIVLPAAACTYGSFPHMDNKQEVREEQTERAGGREEEVRGWRRRPAVFYPSPVNQTPVSSS